MGHRLVTFELRCHLVARTFQNVLSGQVLPPTGDKRACYSVAECISADFNDESSMRARTRNVV